MESWVKRTRENLDTSSLEEFEGFQTFLKEGEYTAQDGSKISVSEEEGTIVYHIERPYLFYKESYPLIDWQKSNDRLLILMEEEDNPNDEWDYELSSFFKNDDTEKKIIEANVLHESSNLTDKITVFDLSGINYSMEKLDDIIHNLKLNTTIADAYWMINCYERRGDNEELLAVEWSNLVEENVIWFGKNIREMLI